MSKEVIIKSLKNKKESIIPFPLCLTINTEKSSKIYTTLCSLRNMLIENGIINKELRYNMYFYNEENLKIKESDVLSGVIYLSLDNMPDYSEPCNILYHLEKRIATFEFNFKTLYEKYNEEKENKDTYYVILKKEWSEFKEINDDCFDYAEWYFIMKPIAPEIGLLSKMALDIKKWVIQKEKIIAEIDIDYLSRIEYKEKEDDYSLVENLVYNL